MNRSRLAILTWAWLAHRVKRRVILTFACCKCGWNGSSAEISASPSFLPRSHWGCWTMQISSDFFVLDGKLEIWELRKFQESLLHGESIAICVRLYLEFARFALVIPLLYRSFDGARCSQTCGKQNRSETLTDAQHVLRTLRERISLKHDFIQWRFVLLSLISFCLFVCWTKNSEWEDRQQNHPRQTVSLVNALNESLSTSIWPWALPSWAKASH